VISRREHDGRPFILYLRDFLGGSREGVVKSHYYTQDNKFTIDNKLIEQVSPEIGVVFVQSEAEEELWATQDGHGLGPSGPSLRLPDTSWKEMVEGLIDLAEVIFVDAPVLSAGTKFELECCLQKNKLHQTVVILSPPNFMRWEENIKPSDESNILIQHFPRVVWSDDLRDDVAGDFTINDLIERARAIANLPAEERAQLARSGRLNAAFPVKYTDVADQYIQRSAIRAATRQPWHEDPWEDNWERTFWGFHRAVLTIHAMMDSGVGEAKDYVDKLIACYREMVNLLCEAHTSEKGVVTRGDFELGIRLSEIAVKWAALSDKPHAVRICEEMLAEASSRAALIKSEKIPYRAILRTLYLADRGEAVSV
jgi:hypothetical protein